MGRRCDIFIGGGFIGVDCGYVSFTGQKILDHMWNRELRDLAFYKDCLGKKEYEDNIIVKFRTPGSQVTI